MSRLMLTASLAAYSIVASQPLAYLVFLRAAQRALSAPAYIELRQRINAVMRRRIPAIYLGTMAVVLSLIVLSLRTRDWSVVATATVALLCLVVDLALMLRENVPINGIIDCWSTTDYPADWEDYRTQWFAVFGYRQVALLIGFSSLLAGAVFR